MFCPLNQLILHWNISSTMYESHSQIWNWSKSKIRQKVKSSCKKTWNVKGEILMSTAYFNCIIQGGYFNRGLTLPIQNNFRRMQSEVGSMFWRPRTIICIFEWNRCYTQSCASCRNINPIRLFLFVQPPRYNCNIFVLHCLLFPL